MIKIILVLVAICIVYILWQRQELKKFQVTHYTVANHKIKSPMTLLLVSDYHCHPFGEKNQRLKEAVAKADPDLIFVAGDMIVSAHTQEYPIALQFFETLSKEAPVYFANGNHESRVEIPESAYYEAYQNYKEQVQNMGVHILNNQREETVYGENSLTIYGLDIPLECYAKGRNVPLPKDYLTQTLGKVEKERFTILIAHNPMFCEDYAGWGADLILSGHTHGGLVRVPGVGSLLSPQFEIFPKYDSGEFTLGDSRIIVSRGLGTHTFHIRIFDRAELAVIHLEPTRH